jgi:hypothetical protein
MLAPVDELRCRRFPIRCRHDAVSLPVQRDRRLYGEPFPKLLVRWVARRKARDGSAPGIHRRHQKREGRRCRYPVLEFYVPAELVQVLPLSNQMKHLIVQIIHVLAELADIFLSVPGR